MAEGDKVVPSEGNSQLDPTKKVSGALNERLGITGRSLNNQGYVSRTFGSSSWVRNNAGMLTHVNDLKDNTQKYQQLHRYGKSSQGLLSSEELRDRGEDERDKGREYLKGPKNRGSSQGDEQAGDEEERPQTIYNQPSGRVTNTSLMIGTVQQSFGTLPTLREMMAMPIVNVPHIGFGKTICGPAIIGTMNFNGAAMQVNGPEAMTTGQGINLEAQC